MGAKGSKKPQTKPGDKPAAEPVAKPDQKPQPKPTPTVPKGPELTENDYQFLTSQTGHSRAEIKALFDKFHANNPDAKLDKREFVKLYTELRPEKPDNLDEISEFIFRAFDTDHNGFITFNEFMIAYSLTSKGDLRKKLEYAFYLYDSDNNGYLDNDEVKEVITGMLDLLGAEKKHNDIPKLAHDIIKELDTSSDGKISKDEFINGLLKNFSLRAMMSPFS